jgi:hypothetical protein
MKTGSGLLGRETPRVFRRRRTPLGHRRPACAAPDQPVRVSCQPEPRPASGPSSCRPWAGARPAARRRAGRVRGGCPCGARSPRACCQDSDGLEWEGCHAGVLIDHANQTTTTWDAYHPPPGRTSSVMEPGPAGRPPAPMRRTSPAGLRTACSSRSASVGSSMSASTTVVSTPACGPAAAGRRQLLEQRGVELGDHLGTGAADQLDQRGRMRHPPLQLDAAEPPPADRFGHLPAQALIAKPVAVLEVQQPQQGVDGDRKTAQPPVEQRPPRAMKRSSSRWRPPGPARR